MRIEILLQDELRGNLINDLLTFSPRGVNFQECTFTLDGREPLIYELHRDADASSQGLRECQHPLGLGPAFSAQGQRKAHDDRFSLMLRHQLADGLKSDLGALSRDDREPLRGQSEGITESDPDTPLTHIQAQDPHGMGYA